MLQLTFDKMLMKSSVIIYLLQFRSFPMTTFVRAFRYHSKITGGLNSLYFISNTDLHWAVGLIDWGSKLNAFWR